MKSKQLFKLKDQAVQFFDPKHHEIIADIDYWIAENVSDSALEPITEIDFKLSRLLLLGVEDISKSKEYDLILDLWRDGKKYYQIAEEIGADRKYVCKIMKKIALVNEDI